MLGKFLCICDNIITFSSTSKVYFGKKMLATMEILLLLKSESSCSRKLTIIRCTHRSGWKYLTVHWINMFLFCCCIICKKLNVYENVIFLPLSIRVLFFFTWVIEVFFQDVIISDDRSINYQSHILFFCRLKNWTRMQWNI